MKIVVLSPAVLGTVRFAYAVAVGIRDGVVRKEIRRGSNQRVLAGTAAVRYAVFCIVGGCVMITAMLTIVQLTLEMK